MKALMQNKFTKYLIYTLIHLAAALMAQNSAFADDSVFNTPVDTVANLQIEGTLAYQGQYMTVIYGINNSVLFNNSGNAYLSKIRIQTPAEKVMSNSILIPSQKIERRGIFESYNAIVIAFHRQPVLNWKNADNSVPQGATVGDSDEFTNTITISKKEYLRIKESQGNPSVVRIDIGGY